MDLSKVSYEGPEEGVTGADLANANESCLWIDRSKVAPCTRRAAARTRSQAAHSYPEVFGGSGRQSVYSSEG